MYRCALLAVTLASASTAYASMTPVLSSVTAAGSNFAFNYSVHVPDTERLDPTATNGVTCPGPSSTEMQCNPTGTFFTIYDIDGFVSVQPPLPSNWTFTTQSTGLTPSAVSKSFDGGGTNVTFTYTGPIVSGPVTSSAFTILSTTSLSNTEGAFSSQDTKNLTDAVGSSVQGTGFVEVPAFPPTPTSTPTNTPTVTPTATNTRFPNGTACTSPADCGSGFCIDSVCCDTACNQPSQACNLDGRVGTCSSTAAPAPAMSVRGLLAALAVLTVVSALALGRRGLFGRMQ